VTLRAKVGGIVTKNGKDVSITVEFIDNRTNRVNLLV
jgi:hypothetical protein